MTARRNALIVGGALSLFALVAASIPAAVAQDATPPAGTPVAQEGTPVAQAAVSRPVHIHAGDCSTLGEVVYPLVDLTSAVGSPIGQADEAIPVESSFTNVPVTFDALLAADYAINVHLSAEAIDTYLACGELGGVVDPNGALSIGLREQSNSGYTGVAFLQPSVDGLSTDVSVFITPVFGAAG